MYSAEVLDHFQNPRNAGTLDTADVTAQMENPVCGDVLELRAKLEGRKIVEISFRAKGCVPAMACGSAVTELVKNKKIDEARQVSREELIGKVGGLPPASSHAAQLALNTLEALLRDL